MGKNLNKFITFSATNKIILFKKWHSPTVGSFIDAGCGWRRHCGSCVLLESIRVQLKATVSFGIGTHVSIIPPYQIIYTAHWQHTRRVQTVADWFCIDPGSDIQKASACVSAEKVNQAEGQMEAERGEGESSQRGSSCSEEDTFHNYNISLLILTLNGSIDLIEPSLHGGP